MPQPGGMVIRALVRARLLGLQILTLDAQVVVRPEDGHAAAAPPLLVWSAEPAGPLPGPELERPLAAGSESGVTRASELLVQSAAALERSRQSS